MKIAIVGAARTSRGLAPYSDPSWEIWACSPSNKDSVPRCSAWFELHCLDDLQSEQWRPWVKPYAEFLNQGKFRVYMQETNALVPGALALPIKAILKEFGEGFFTSSIAMMIGFAVLQKPKEIALYGVDMTAGSEYDYERPGAQHLVRLARARGIKVTIPPQSDLDAPLPLYGYGDANPMAIKLKAHAYEMRARVSGYEKRLAEIEQEKAQLIQDRQHLLGAIEENIYVRRTWLAWSGPDP